MCSACSNENGTVQDDSGGGSLGRDIQTTVCISDVECQDGLFCNGAELCEPDEKEADDFGCLAARRRPKCDDGVDCTIDECSNSEGSCLYVAPDKDQDGHGDASCHSKDGDLLGDDCDDDDSKRFPGNVEVCDGDDHDEDCDLSTYGERDRDGDTELDAACCNGSGKQQHCGTDCNDLNINQRSKQPEFCDDVDNDCDGEVDDDAGPVAWYPDDDADLFGHLIGSPEESCTPIPGKSVSSRDCQDGDDSRHPGQIELCDDVDNDCDGLVDEPSYCDTNGGFESGEDDPTGSGGTGAGDGDGDSDGSGGDVSEDGDGDGSGGDVSGDGDGDGSGGANAPGCVRDLHGRYVLRDDGTAAYMTSDTTFPVRDEAEAEILQGFVGIDDGDGWGCGVLDNETESGTVWCWLTSTGSGNTSGQLGIGHVNSVSPGQYRASADGPVKLSDESTLTEIVGIGRYSSFQTRDYTCAFDAVGQVYCWGNVAHIVNAGVALTSGYALKISVDSNGDPFDGVLQLALGYAHACALREVDGENEVWCWGYNSAGQVGTGTVSTNVPTPAYAAGTRGASAVATTYTSTCVLLEGEVHCWGSNGGGEAGVGNSTNPIINRTPVVTGLASETPPRLTEVVALHGGYGGYCASTAEGKLYCWGYGMGTSGSTTFASEMEVTGAVSSVGHSQSGNYYYVSDDSPLTRNTTPITNPCTP